MLLACGIPEEAMFWLIPVWLLVVAGALGLGILGWTVVVFTKSNSWMDAAGSLLSGTALALGLIVVAVIALSAGSPFQDAASRIGEIVSNPVLWSNLVGATIGVFGLNQSVRKSRRSSRGI